jgi:signal transduction histidine kinase
LNDLLDLSKLESGKMEFKMAQGFLNDTVDRSVMELDSLLKSKEIQVVLEGENIAKSNAFYGDHQHLIQVFVNLLSNAIKFSPIKSAIKINFENSEILVKDQEKSPAILCSIMDQGMGIPEGELESVFDKFVQSSKTKTGAGGTGLGLSICREIVGAHNGKIWASNQKDGGGAAFHVLLPLNGEEEA